MTIFQEITVLGEGEAWNPPGTAGGRPVQPCPYGRKSACSHEGGAGDDEMRHHLLSILRKKLLFAIFQPIIGMDNGEMLGYEGLIRGPSDSPLHSPVKLFEAAARFGLTDEVESLSRLTVVAAFAAKSLPGKLFMNTSPECLLKPHPDERNTLALLQEIGLSPERIIIELTESSPIYDYRRLREAAVYYQRQGFKIAIDDLGEGFSGLRLWSELRPDFVKIDQHFIQGINQDPIKLQFVKSIQQIAENSASQIIAEGIETRAEFAVVRDLGIAYGQGYFIARPASVPTRVLPHDVAEAVSLTAISVYPQPGGVKQSATARKLQSHVAPVAPNDQQESVYNRFARDPDLKSLPVVEAGVPIGLISRYDLIEKFSRPFFRELNSKKPCAALMRTAPIVVEASISIEDLGQKVALAGENYLADGFVVTDGGRYIGMATGYALMREITQLQISAARYANPLTFLPGNVPINQHIDRLLESKAAFHACYCDLDYFKPFNDVYGYRKGDDVIQMMSRILVNACDPERDFVGHIGGDDFILLFQSPDWESRCRDVLATFEREVQWFFDEEIRVRGGFISEDRLGNPVFYPVTSMSIGAVGVEAGAYASHHEIAAAAAEAKKMAKRTPGNTLFIERRKPVKILPGSGAPLAEHEDFDFG